MVFCISPPWAHGTTVITQTRGWINRTIVPCGHESNVDAKMRYCDTKAITIGLLYYNSPNLLRVHLRLWNNLSTDILSHTRFIVVDDCSERDMSAVNIIRAFANDRFEIKVLTINPPKILWNMPGALNLLMYHTNTCWTMKLDVDHIMPGLEMLLPIATSSSWTSFHRFHRTNPVSTVHPSNWLMHKASYWRAGGSDEDFSGHYGDDYHLMWMLKQSGSHSIIHRTPKLTTMKIKGGKYNVSMTRDLKRNLNLHKQKLSGTLPLPQRYLRFSWNTLSDIHASANPV